MGSDLKRQQKTVRFCKYCHENGHTPNWCRKKTRDEEIRRLQQDMSLKKILLRYGNTELLTPIVATSTIKTWNYALIRTM